MNWMYRNEQSALLRGGRMTAACADCVCVLGRSQATCGVRWSSFHCDRHRWMPCASTIITCDTFITILNSMNNPRIQMRIYKLRNINTFTVNDLCYSQIARIPSIHLIQNPITHATRPRRSCTFIELNLNSHIIRSSEEVKFILRYLVCVEVVVLVVVVVLLV